MATDEHARLVAWVKKKRGDMSYAQFADVTGVSKSTLQRFEAGENDLSFSSKVALAQAFNDFPEWAVSRDAVGLAASRDPKQRGTEPPARAAEFGEYVELSLYDITAAMGHGKWNEGATVKTYLQFRRDWLMWTFGTTTGLSLINSDGRSMIKTIPEQSIVMIRDCLTWNIGEGVYFMRLHGRDVLKRVTPIGFETAGAGDLGLRATVSSDTDDKASFPTEEILFTDEMRHENDIYASAEWVAHRL